MRNNLQSLSTTVADIKQKEDGKDYTVLQRKPHRCTYEGCNASFVRPSKLARHIRSHTGERPYKCDHPGCDKAYTNTSHLKRHMEVHSLMKQVYQCPICSLSVSTASNLKRHIKRAHEETNKLTCAECNAEFTKKYQLAKHLYTHLKCQSHKCEKCNVSYTNLQKLKKHEATHVAKRSYACDISSCTEVFQTWQQLCTHKQTKHVKDYRCGQCNKLFLSKVHLKNHSIIHSENRPVVVCPYDKCHRSYYNKKNLDAHIRSKHLGERFYCDICSVGLVSKGKLVEHMERFHISPPKKKSRKKQPRKKRKDAGSIKKSAISVLIGVKLPPKVDKILLQHNTDEPLPSQSMCSTETVKT